MSVESPETVHGRLLEAVHLSGYSFTRACDELLWLLDDDRWRQVGGGFENVNGFLATIDFSDLKIAVEQRKALAKRLAEIEASQRATARALGVSHEQIRRDLGVTSVTPDADEPTSGLLEPDEAGTNVTPEPEWFQDDVDPAKLARGRSDRKKRDKDAEQQRIAEDREQSLEAVPTTVDIRHGDFREVLADLTDIDAIITDPPYPGEFLPLLDDLAEWADKVLSPDGIMAVLFGQTHLPEVYRRLDGHRPYRWTGALFTPGNAYVSQARRVQSNWKPILVYGGGPRFADVVRSEGADLAAKEHHKWGQDLAAFQTLVERLTEPGQTVADPFMGSGTTLLAARLAGRHAIGADIDPECVAQARKRIDG